MVLLSSVVVDCVDNSRSCSVATIVSSHILSRVSTVAIFRNAQFAAHFLARQTGTTLPSRGFGARIQASLTSRLSSTHDVSVVAASKITTFPMSYPRNNMVVTFLGTTSGGGPTETRNCSSLVVDPAGSGYLWSTCKISTLVLR